MQPKNSSLSRAARVRLASGIETSGLKLIDSRPLIFPASMASKISQAVRPVLRKLGFGDAPEVRDEFAMFRILDVARARQLIAALAVFASALTVALAGDGSVAAAGLADASGCQHEIDVGETVLDALGVMLDASRVQQHGGLGRSPDFGCPDDACGRNTGDRFGTLRRVLSRRARSTSSNPSVCASMNSRSIQPRSIITCRIPLASALSRPGRTGRKRSAVRAIGVMRGSMTMIFAPLSRARQT